MPQAMAMQSNYQKGGERNDLLPSFLAENFCGWADQWDILKDELREIAVVSFLNCEFSVPTFIRQFVISPDSATESYKLFWN